MFVKQRFAAVKRVSKSFLPPSCVKILRLAHVQHPHADGRFRVEKADRKKFILPVKNHRQFTVTPARFCSRTLSAKPTDGRHGPAFPPPP